jgi:type IV pilus assembly protein PilC
MKFNFKARDWSGKLVKGVLDLHDKSEALESIKNNGLVPVSITEVKETIFKEIYKSLFSKIGTKQISTFTRQISTMMTSGLSLTDSLSLLKNQLDKRTLMSEVLEYTLENVRGGKSLADGLRKYKKYFGEAYIASVEAGEEAGVLEEVMTKLADNLEKQSEFQGKVKGAMVYPVIVVIGMVIVVVIMMVFVIPKLLGLFTEFGAELPASTKALMAISGFFTKYWYIMLALVIGVIAFFGVGGKNKDIRLKIDTYKFKIPIMGDLNKKSLLADTIRTLSMLLSAGIPLVEALRIVSNVAGNALYMNAYLHIAERVQKGFSIANSFEETGNFPIIVNQMVATGEATGKLDSILLRVSDYFSTEAEQSVKALTSAIEPVIMIFLGLGVAFLVVAVMMPIYNLTSQF